MIDIPKPPERGTKTLEEYVNELERWAQRVYPALVYISEQLDLGGNNSGK